MAKGNKTFKKRVADAVKSLVAQHNLIQFKHNSLYTPQLRNGTWSWSAFSEPDGILAKEVTVAKGNPAKPDECTSVWVAVLVQCEESTSDNLLNPWGKANIPNIPGGVWIDKVDSKRTRNILTTSHVLFVSPEPSSTRRKVRENYKKRKEVLERIDAASADASLLMVPQGRSTEDLAKSIWLKIARHLS